MYPVMGRGRERRSHWPWFWCKKKGHWVVVEICEERCLLKMREKCKEYKNREEGGSGDAIV